MRYEILITGCASAEANMARDSQLLQSLTNDPRCLLHFYDWERPSATYGYFIDPADHLNLPGVARQGVDLARRPTGGGIIFHHCDLAFSILVPATHPGYSLNTLSNYALINHAVAEAICLFAKAEPDLLPLEPLSSEAKAFCMAKPTRYDVMLERRKVGGGAQRRMRQGFLHQGTIALGLPGKEFLEDLLGEPVISAMASNSLALLGSTYTEIELYEARQVLRQLLIQTLRKVL